MDFIKKISAVNWIKIALIAIVLIGVIVYVSQKKEVGKIDTTNSVATTTTSAKTGSKTTSATAANVTSKCGFKITSPTINSGINVPFTVSGTVNKLNVNGCIWNENNARAGLAEIFYNRNGEGWKTAGVSVPVYTSSIPGAPTTTVAFESTFNLNRTALGLGAGTPVKIVFTELNNPVQANPDNFYYLVYLK